MTTMFEVMARRVEGRTFIQGGAYRLDKGPTPTEIGSFRLAAGLHAACLAEGKATTLGCIVNDLGIPAQERPKATGRSILPIEYFDLLTSAGIPAGEVQIVYESTLRNKVGKDASRHGLPVALKVNEETGVAVPICVSIMGRFYSDLAIQGYARQIGFFVQEPKPSDDQSCPFGPVYGAREDRSGYALRLDVMNFWVHADGRVSSPLIAMASTTTPISTEGI